MSVAAAPALRVLYLCDALLICSKPAGLLSVPGLGAWRRAACASALLERWHGRLPPASRPSAFPRGALLQAAAACAS